ncbi:MAG TPA: hypothetical protein VG125_32885 [Pirellulales bacterium]|jgi:hypothetical protein|nr:hypothetical protein [Pirellulales bacterium]
MESPKEPLRDRLIAQQEPTLEKLARYRKEVDDLQEQLRRHKWWIDAVRAVLITVGAIVLFPLSFFFGMVFLYLLAGPGSVMEAWLPGTAGLVCLVGAIALLRWFFRRRSDDLLLQVKRLQAQGLEFEERLRGK